MSEEIKAMLAELMAGIQNVMNNLNGNDEPDLSPEEMMEKAKHLEDDALKAMETAEKAEHDKDEDADEKKKIAESMQTKAAKATEISKAGKVMKAAEFEDAITADNKAEERIEEVQTSDSEEAIELVQKSIKSLSDAIKKPSPVQKQIDKKEGADLEAINTNIMELTKVMKSLNDRINVHEKGLENIFDMMGVTDEVQKIMKSEKPANPVVNSLSDFENIIEKVKKSIDEPKETQGDRSKKLALQAAGALSGMGGKI